MLIVDIKECRNDNRKEQKQAVSLEYWSPKADRCNIEERYLIIIAYAWLMLCKRHTLYIFVA